MIDYTINIASIVQIALLIIGGFVTIGCGLIAFGAFRKTFEQQGAKIIGVEGKIDKLGEIVVTMAVANKRLDNVEEDIRDMKRGRGFIRGRNGVEGEYT